jgi:hypothetical protein
MDGWMMHGWNDDDNHKFGSNEIGRVRSWWNQKVWIVATTSSLLICDGWSVRSSRAIIRTKYSLLDYNIQSRTKRRVESLIATKTRMNIRWLSDRPMGDSKTPKRGRPNMYKTHLKHAPSWHFYQHFFAKPFNNTLWTSHGARAWRMSWKNISAPPVT